MIINIYTKTTIELNKIYLVLLHFQIKLTTKYKFKDFIDKHLTALCIILFDFSCNQLLNKLGIINKYKFNAF